MSSFFGLSAGIRESAVLAEVSALGAFGRLAVRFPFVADRSSRVDQAPLDPFGFGGHFIGASEKSSRRWLEIPHCKDC